MRGDTCQYAHGEQRTWLQTQLPLSLAPNICFYHGRKLSLLAASLSIQTRQCALCCACVTPSAQLSLLAISCFDHGRELSLLAASLSVQLSACCCCWFVALASSTENKTRPVQYACSNVSPVLPVPAGIAPCWHCPRRAPGVFESWLHPSRYRTQLCKDHEKCDRPVCFFAHSVEELRTPENSFVPGPEERLRVPEAMQVRGAQGDNTPWLDQGVCPLAWAAQASGDNVSKYTYRFSCLCLAS